MARIRLWPILMAAMMVLSGWAAPLKVGDPVRIVSNRYGAKQVSGTIYSKEKQGVRVRYLGNDGVIYILPFPVAELAPIASGLIFKVSDRVEILTDSFGARGVVGVVSGSEPDRVMVRYWGHDGQSYLKPFQADELRKL